jgi:hypothetical protein
MVLLPRLLICARLYLLRSPNLTLNSLVDARFAHSMHLVPYAILLDKLLGSIIVSILARTSITKAGGQHIRHSIASRDLPSAWLVLCAAAAAVEIAFATRLDQPAIGSRPSICSSWPAVARARDSHALIYAASESHVASQITLDALQWASELSLLQTRRQL